MDDFPSSSDEAGEIGRDGTGPFVGEVGRIEKRPEDAAVEGKEELLLASLMGDDGRVLALTGEDEGLGRMRAPSPNKLIVGGINGILPAEPSSGEGGKGRPLVKLLLRSRGCSRTSGDGTELDEPERPELMASCELDALAARSEEGSGRERFQYGRNLVREEYEEDASLRSDGDATGEAEGGFVTSLAGLELLKAASEEVPGTERGRGRGRLQLVGEVGEGDGRVEAGWWDGMVTPELGSEPESNERAWDGGEVGTGVGPGVGSGGRMKGEVTWDGSPPGVGNGLRGRPFETGLVGGEEWFTRGRLGNCCGY